MTIPPWLRRHGDAIVVPVALIIVYAVFISTANANRPAQILAVCFLFVVLFLWMTFRRLRVHATAARLAAVGEPEQLLALADEELRTRWLHGGDVALHIYRAMAHNLAGRTDEARKALDAAGVKPGDRRTRNWALLWAAADIDTRTRQGDAAGARATFDRMIVPFARFVPSRGVGLIADECEARVKLAEGDAAGARALVAPLVKDIRLGPAARAALHAIQAACDRKLGDEAAAKAAADKARSLAPKCTFV